MSVLLKDVISTFGYTNDNQKIALIKLAAYRNCFGEEYKNKIISDDKAKQLLNNSFKDLDEGISWLGDVTQKNWLRSTFQKEGVGKDKDPTLNVARWNIKDADITTDEEQQLLAIFKILGLVDTVEWPNCKVEHVVIHGALEDMVKERIHFIPDDFSGHLYYMTNPRGLFNNEPSLAPILASWFERPDAEKIIQDVLDKHKNMNESHKNWLKDLAGLKQEILTALDTKSWPEGKGWYYKNPGPFDKAASAEGRQSLAGWPTGLDMAEYLASKKFKNVNNIELHALYSVRPGRVATTEDNIEDWNKQYGHNIPKNQQIVFVSNNSKRLHYIHFQDVIMKSGMPESISQRAITVGLGANDISLSAATDVFAKIFYMKRKQYELLKLREYFENLEKYKELSIELERATPVSRPDDNGMERYVKAEYDASSFYREKLEGKESVHLILANKYKANNLNELKEKYPCIFYQATDSNNINNNNNTDAKKIGSSLKNLGLYAVDKKSDSVSSSSSAPTSSFGL